MSNEQRFQNTQSSQLEAQSLKKTVDCCPLTVDYHESQIRLADSLYKNYLPQYNFEEVKAAVMFFDSLRLTTDLLESENLKTSESEKSCEQRAMSNEPFLESENLKTSEPEKVLESHHYFIVGGSFQTLDRAEFCLKDIRSQGFENASLLEKNEKGYIRVYYESFVEKSDALIRLDVIKNDFNESAWLLFQK